MLQRTISSKSKEDLSLANKIEKQRLWGTGHEAGRHLISFLKLRPDGKQAAVNEPLFTGLLGVAPSPKDKPELLRVLLWPHLLLVCKEKGRKANKLLILKFALRLSPHVFVSPIPGSQTVLSVTEAGRGFEAFEKCKSMRAFSFTASIVPNQTTLLFISNNPALCRMWIDRFGETVATVLGSETTLVPSTGTQQQPRTEQQRTPDAQSQDTEKLKHQQSELRLKLLAEAELLATASPSSLNSPPIEASSDAHLPAPTQKQKGSGIRLRRLKSQSSIPSTSLLHTNFQESVQSGIRTLQRAEELRSTLTPASSSAKSTSFSTPSPRSSPRDPSSRSAPNLTASHGRAIEQSGALPVSPRSQLSTDEKRQQLRSMKGAPGGEAAQSEQPPTEMRSEEQTKLLKTAYSAAIMIWQSTRKMDVLSKSPPGAPTVSQEQRPHSSPPRRESAINRDAQQNQPEGQPSATTSSSSPVESKSALGRQSSASAGLHVNQAAGEDRSRDAEDGVLYEAIADYAPIDGQKREQVLYFQLGAVITMIRAVADGWAFGRYEGKKGMFPLNCVRRIVLEDPNKPSALALESPDYQNDINELMNFMTPEQSLRLTSSYDLRPITLDTALRGLGLSSSSSSSTAVEVQESEAASAPALPANGEEPEVEAEEDTDDNDDEEEEEEDDEEEPDNDFEEDLVTDPKQRDIIAFEKEAGELAGWLELEIKRRRSSPKALQNAQVFADHLRAKAIVFLETFASEPAAIPIIVRVHEALSRYDREVEGAEEKVGLLSVTRVNVKKLIAGKTQAASSSSSSNVAGESSSDDDRSDSSGSDYSEESEEDDIFQFSGSSAMYNDI